MNTPNSIFSFKILSILFLFFLTGCAEEDNNSIFNANNDGSSNLNGEAIETTLENYPIGTLTQEERDGLLFMREEEKLAHDVYSSLFDIWSQKIFANISDSEQTHTDAVLILLDRYNEIDPVANNAIGIFTDSVLQTLYDDLIIQGTLSLIEALQVGAAIEEIDMIDIQKYILQVENNDDITLIYENLLKGSRNHLRSFVSNLSKQGITYIPQFMDVTKYNNIINSPMENG